MIRKFDWIRNSGFFENFRWDSKLPEFARINVIYGPNGSGKTSLARAVDCVRSMPASDGYKSLSIMLDNSGTIQSTNGHDDPVFDRIHVFSERYVERSHKFVGETEVDAVLTLGERTIEDEQRISELNGLIATAEDDLGKASKASGQASKALESEYTTIARGIVTALSRAGEIYRSNSNYSQGRVKTRFNGSHETWALLSEAEKKSDLAIVNSDNREPVTARSYSLSVRSELRQETAALLSSTPTSVVLDTLTEHEEATGWVEEGRHLHEHLSTCIFCGGSLTSERKTEIEQHFSAAVEAAQNTADALIEELEGVQSTLKTLLGDGAMGGSLFDDLRQDVADAHRSAKAEADALTKWVGNLLKALNKKRANVISRVEYVFDAPPIVNGSKIEEVIRKHNTRVEQHSQLVSAAAKRVEMHLLKESESRVGELAEAESTAKKIESDLEEKLKEYRDEVTALENVEGDPRPSADVMAKELTRILGRGELSFELLPDGKHYRITRHGQPARDLSAGERTAITLIHFLEYVKRAETSGGKPIVIIDDPISSLDSGSAMGISTYIWSETVSKDHIEQVFLLTHNFELFRQWDIQIGGLPGGERGPTNKAYSSNCYELMPRHEKLGGELKRSPAFIIWPPSEEARRKVRSAYHHAFITAARARAALIEDSSMEKKLDALLLYPNVLRRMLETFLAFKDPSSVGNFTTAMRVVGATLESLEYGGDADALRLQLTRFTHANSHAESPETDVSVNPDEIEAILVAVFTFMEAVDHNHFVGLCSVSGFDATDLLVPAPEVVDAAAPSRVAREGRGAGTGMRPATPA